VDEGNARLEWPISGVRNAMQSDEVHLWAWALAPSTVGLPAHIAILDQRELERAYRFHFAADRERYAVAHANLRRILGGYLNQRPEKICFRTGAFGKPELADGDPPLHFNLAHSRSIATLAVAHGLPLGVDVEDIRPIEPEVARSHFSARELSDLDRLQGGAWLSGFYRCWTCKEAILKAEGVGLQCALDSFDVALLPDAPAELLETRTPFKYPWKLFHLAPAAGTTGALATAHREPRLSCFTFVSSPNTTRG
jgi:4'-phosphopantetheinyl transferase